jgi:uroporphyrinogen decarboxylase
MTSRERIIAVLERREPDRLPTFEWKISQPVIDGFVPGGDVFDFIQEAEHDAVCCSPSYEKIEIIDEDTFVDEFHITRHLTGPDRYPVSVGHPITDMESFRKYEPPPLDSPIRFTKIEDAVSRFGARKAVVVNLHDIFSFPRDMMGLDNFLISFITDPELVRELVVFSVDYNLELARLVKKRGIEIIGIGDDFADNKGPFVSPEMFARILYPEFRRVVQGYKKLGFYVIKHSDGNLNPILDMLVDAGIDCLDPIDPLGSMDIGDVRERYGDRIARKGNIDCVYTLVEGTPEEVEREVRDCIRRGSPGGGHIISSSNSLHAGVNPELYRVMLDSVREHGHYPLEDTFTIS